MLMYGWMKWVELAPERYDWAVSLMTAGRLDRIKDLIAGQINTGDRVLDLGSGTGTLALRCLRQGASVTCLDSSVAMIEKTRRIAAAAGYGDQIRLVNDSMTRVADNFAPNQFDVITATLALGEFSQEYRKYILRDCYQLLRPGGLLLIADEVYPEKLPARLLYLNMLLLFWIPQFLILRRVYFPIRNLVECISDSGFEVSKVDTWSINSLQLVRAVKRPGAETGK